MRGHNRSCLFGDGDFYFGRVEIESGGIDIDEDGRQSCLPGDLGDRPERECGKDDFTSAGKIEGAQNVVAGHAAE